MPRGVAVDDDPHLLARDDEPDMDAWVVVQMWR
jgi:hypothetical protein